MNCSKLEPDKTGKDFIVEFDLAEPNKKMSFDKRPPPIQVVVQVKTILAKNKTARVTLSVAERLVKDSHPAVICILKIDKDDRIISMHLNHLFDDQLGRVLERLRRCSKNGDTKLHLKTITFAATTANAIPLEAEALSLALERLANAGMLEYADAKKRQCSELGYDEYGFTGRFSLSDVPVDEVIDGFLGLRDLPIQQLFTTERRFNIELPEAEAASGTIRITPNAQFSATIVITAVSTKETLALDSDFLVVPPGITGASGYAASFTTKLGIFVLRLGKWTFTQSGGFDRNAEHLSGEWIEFLLCAKILSLGAISISVHAKGNRTPFSIVTDNHPQAEWTSVLENYLAIVRKLEVINSKAGAHSRKFSLEQVWARRHEIDALAAVCTTGGTIVDIATDAGTFPPLEAEQGVFMTAVDIGCGWIGVFLPIEVTTVGAVSGVLWQGRQRGDVLLEQIVGDDVSHQFEQFRAKMKKISNVTTVIFQEPHASSNEGFARIEYSGGGDEIVTTASPTAL